MTIPNLMQAYKEKVTVTQVRQAFSILTHAYKMAEIDLGENFRSNFDYRSGQSGSDDFWKAFKPYYLDN